MLVRFGSRDEVKWTNVGGSSEFLMRLMILLWLLWSYDFAKIVGRQSQTTDSAFVIYSNCWTEQDIYAMYTHTFYDCHFHVDNCLSEAAREMPCTIFKVTCNWSIIWKCRLQLCHSLQTHSNAFWTCNTVYFIIWK